MVLAKRGLAAQRALRRRVRTMVLALVAFGCGGGDTSGPTPPTPPITPSPPSIIVANATVAIGGTIPRNAWLRGQPVSQATWRSDNPAIARVSAEGLVTGVAAGTTTIHATAVSPVVPPRLRLPTSNSASLLSVADTHVRKPTEGRGTVGVTMESRRSDA